MTRPGLSIVLLAMLAGGCTIPVRLPGGDTCHADGAIGYVGQRYTMRIGRIVKDKAHATRVRVIPPGTMTTREFRANRVNLDLDERNIVTRIYCG